MAATTKGVYQVVPSKIVDENTRTLGEEVSCTGVIPEGTDRQTHTPPYRHDTVHTQYTRVPQSSSLQVVEDFLSLRVDDRKLRDGLIEQLQLKTMFLDPPCKPSKRTSTYNFPRRLSVKERKRLGLYKISPEQQYENFLPLHHLWLGYMEDLLQIKTSPEAKRLCSTVNVQEVIFSSSSSLLFPREVNQMQLNQRVMKADYHGSIVRVCRSKCPSYVGIEGILLKETQNTLQLISKDNKIRSEEDTINVWVGGISSIFSRGKWYRFSHSPILQFCFGRSTKYWLFFSFSCPKSTLSVYF